VRTRSALALLAALLAGLAAAQAWADASLLGARLGAQDVPALAKFYQSVFGLKEVNRVQAPSGPEIMLNFGATEAAAKADRGTQVVIMHRASDALHDPVPHLIFVVSDMSATVAALKAAGGTLDGNPRPFGKTGMTIGLVRDPAGNRLELIQLAPR